MPTIKAPAPYFGGKQQISGLIASLFPPHTTYVEVFGGMASVLFGKVPSRLEVYNDIESGVVNFFRVLRDPEQCAQLCELLELTPYAREELMACRKGIDDAANPVEKARMWYALAQMSFAGRIHSDTGFRFSKGFNHSPAYSFRSGIDMLPMFTARLRRVVIEHMDFRRLLEAYDAPDTLFYCDPPYLPETRKRKAYACEMTAEDHADLLALLNSRHGHVVLSGYDSPLYRDALRGWALVQVSSFTSAAGHTTKLGLKGKGSVSSRADMRRTECIWISPGAHRQPSLFDAMPDLALESGAIHA
jgi:DNA adenine methylase